MRFGQEQGDHVAPFGMGYGMAFMPGVPGFPPGASWGNTSDPSTQQPAAVVSLRGLVLARVCPGSPRREPRECGSVFEKTARIPSACASGFLAARHRRREPASASAWMADVPPGEPLAFPAAGVSLRGPCCPRGVPSRSSAWMADVPPGEPLAFPAAGVSLLGPWMAPQARHSVRQPEPKHDRAGQVLVLRGAVHIEELAVKDVADLEVAGQTRRRLGHELGAEGDADVVVVEW